MPLAVSSRIGPYDILSPLGAGGLGQVYTARDTRLDRHCRDHNPAVSFKRGPLASRSLAKKP
jgi:hypothetical protein